MPQSPPQISPQVAPEASTIMSHEGEPDNITKDEKAFIKELFDMKQIVRAIYEDINTRLQGQRSNPPKGDKCSKGDGGDQEKGLKREWREW